MAKKSRIKPPDFRKVVAARLRVVMDEFELQTAEDLADEVHAARTAVSNWLNGYCYPPVWKMKPFCEQTGVSLDWLYAGKLTPPDQDLHLRLELRIRKIPVPAAPPEPEPPPPLQQLSRSFASRRKPASAAGAAGRAKRRETS